MDIDILGSYNTLKATLPYLKESGKKHKMDSKSREWIRGHLLGLTNCRRSSVVAPWNWR